ncbi:MAG: DUF58 domain-containing protein [Pseudoflavonifractor sp.]
MARCRVGYLLALAAAVAFYIFYNDYPALYLLLLAVFLPIFSLVLSLPGILGLEPELSVGERLLRRGMNAGAELRLRPGFGLPFARVRAELRCTNLLTGEVFCRRVKASGGSGGLLLKANFEPLHCGCCRWEVRGLRICDYLGLFAFHPAPPGARKVLVLPPDLPPETVPYLLGRGERNPPMTIRPGGGPGEDYDLRPYRPGDPLRSVHWKLSAKTGDLVVRETLEPLPTTIVLTLDLFGSPEDLDRSMDRFDAVSRGLIGEEAPHFLHWADPVTGALCTRRIACQKDLRACQWALMSAPAPKTGPEAGELPLRAPGELGRIRCLHLSAPPEQEAGGEGA